VLFILTLEMYLIFIVTLANPMLNIKSNNLGIDHVL